uniref:Immunoglobulin V-set domain-containing protein n=1 Tax=Paramormyrops kingsleyae TaxID=1676925 RepID=A0A3B3SMR3_9TELE
MRGRGTHQERTEQGVTAWALKSPAGGSIRIPCFYGQQYKHSVKYWCKGKDTSSCSIVTPSDRVSITDDPHNLVFIVTMRNLQKSDDGRYWCAVDDGRIHKATSDEEYMLITAGMLFNLLLPKSTFICRTLNTSHHSIRTSVVLRYRTAALGFSSLRWFVMWWCDNTLYQRTLLTFSLHL